MVLVLAWHLTCLSMSHELKVPKEVDVPLDTLVDEATRLYYTNNWSGAVSVFEKSLINFRMRHHVETTCAVKCKNESLFQQIGLDFTGFDDLKYVGNIIAQGNCIKLCKEEHPYGGIAINFPEKEILDDFESRKPYNFLQYAYFQLGKVKRACQAAQTYYHANLNDDQALRNVEYYYEMEGTNETYFHDLEAPHFHVIYNEAVKSYEAQDYNDAVPKFERVLAEFFIYLEECQSSCFKPIQPIHFHRFYKATALHIMDMLDCSSQCESKLTPVVSGEKIRNFVATCFSYLQFSYYSLNLLYSILWRRFAPSPISVANLCPFYGSEFDLLMCLVGNFQMAVPAAASALLILPDDESARKNINYYERIIEKEKLSREIHYQPRTDATSFYLRTKEIASLSLIGQSILGDPDQDEVEESWQSSLFDEIAAKLNERLQDRLADLL